MRRYLQLFVNQGLLEKSGTTKNSKQAEPANS
ncbi:hypothetical protein [uncultured Streptococcus sp.]